MNAQLYACRRKAAAQYESCNSNRDSCSDSHDHPRHHLDGDSVPAWKAAASSIVGAGSVKFLRTVWPCSSLS